MGLGSFLDALALLLPNIKICLTGDSDIPTLVGTSMLVSNHVCAGDWWALLMFGRCVGLRGAVKVFLRNEYLNIKMETPDADTRNNSSPTSSMTVANSASAPALVQPTQRSTDHGSSGGMDSSGRKTASPDLSLAAKLLHQFLEFPLINGEDYAADKERLFPLLRSFAQNGVSGAPVHLAFYPEGWSSHNGANRETLLAKSNEFAQKEGRPQLKHLLLPRTRGFNACLECLRESSPIVYDVTLAYKGYDGSLPPSLQLSMASLWQLLRKRFPKEVHIRIKRYGMEEVIQDSSWLDKRWQEKDRLLSHFARHQAFPSDGRGYCRFREFNTRSFSVESSLASLTRLLILPFSVPILALMSIPVFWTLLIVWLVNSAIRTLFSVASSVTGGDQASADAAGDISGQAVTPASVNTTPFIPATPFGSPASVMPWFSKRNESPPS